MPRLVEQFEHGLDAPICLTWELTYACNLACVHCLSSSGKRDPRELTTQQCKDIIDELERMQVFYVNIGGGEPTVRPDFWELVDYATAHHVGVKFSTNGVRITPEVAARLAASDYVDVQISLDGATAEVNDAVRGPGSFAMAIRALENLAEAGFTDAKISVVVTRHNVDQLDEFEALAARYGATLRITRLRPSGRGADVWDELHPDRRAAGAALRLAGRQAATACSPATRSSTCPGLGEPGALAGLNLCGAGRVVCLIDPVGDVYACPFAIHDRFLAGNILSDGGFDNVWKNAPLFRELREPQSAGACGSCGHYDSCRGGCMAAKFFTGLPLDGPDPECVQGYGVPALARERDKPKPSGDHSRGSRQSSAGPVPLTLTDAPAGAALQRKSGLSHGTRYLVRDGRRRPAAREEAAAQVGLQRADRGQREGRDRRRQRRGVRRARLRPARRRRAREARSVDNRDGTGYFAAGDDLADRRAGGAPGRRGRRRPGRRGPRHRDGAVVVRQQADRGGRRRQPQDRSSRSTGSAAATRSPHGCERARAAGAVGLIVTTDWSFSHGRDWGSPKIPEQMDLRTTVRMLARGHHPAALAAGSAAKTMRPPDLRVPNQAPRGEPGPPFFAAYGEWMGTPPPTWEDIAWLRELWGGPFMLKGVMRVDDAKRAVDAGVSAISVSNHGGNNLDGTPASIRALPAIADAVGDQIEVLLDGGIRRGSDVVKALALGARAVMIGRAYLWGLAADGQAGVENVLDILRGGIDSALMGLGRASVHDLVAGDILVPAGLHPGARRPAEPRRLRPRTPRPWQLLMLAWEGRLTRPGRRR